MLLNFYSPGYRKKKVYVTFFFSPHLAIAQAFLLSFKILCPNGYLTSPLVICAKVPQMLDQGSDPMW